MTGGSNIPAPTQFIETKLETFGYRRFGNGSGLPLLCLLHFTGTLDNWDPAVTDPLASGREVILFESADLGAPDRRGRRKRTRNGSARATFVNALGLTHVDLLGFSLGGMVAQEIALERPSLVRRMLLVGTAPEGGEDIMHVEKPELKEVYDADLPASQRLVKLFFAPSTSSQAAGEAFVARLAQRTHDREPISGPKVATAQIAAFRPWEAFTGERFVKLHKMSQPCLVVNGVFIMIPVRNSYLLSEHLPNVVLVTYRDSGYGSLFQFHGSFTRHATAFLASDSPVAAY